MRHLAIFLITFLLVSNSGVVRAQDETSSLQNTLGVSFQKINIGHGLQVNYTRSLNQKWYYGAGLYVHFNALPKDNQGHFFHNRGWADKWYQHLGLNLNINRNLISYQSTQFYSFFNVHVLRTSFRESDYFPLHVPHTVEATSTLSGGRLYGPHVTVENTLGLGITTMLSQNVGFRIRGGVGLSIFYDNELYPIQPTKILGSQVWTGMTMVSTGFFYRF